MPGTILLFLLAAGGIAILLTPLFNAPSSTPVPTIPVPATQPAGTPQAGNTRAAPAPSAKPTPLTRADRWLNGLTAMQQHINNVIFAPRNITPATMRHEARTLQRCAAQLSALGSPPSLLQRAYDDARQACAELQHGARCDAAEARLITEHGPDANTEKLNSCIGTYVFDGNDLLGFAVSEGDLIASGS
jgi:hypothetical protein